jgi:hypothetical protein
MSMKTSQHRENHGWRNPGRRALPKMKQRYMASIKLPEVL